MSTAFTIIGIFAILYSIIQLIELLLMPYENAFGEPWMPYLVYGLPCALLLGCAIFLIVQRERLATRVVPVDAPIRAEPSAGATELAFLMLGLLLVIKALPGLGSLVAEVTLSSEPTAIGSDAYIAVGRYLGTIAQLLAGGYLLFFAGRITTWWRQRRQLPATENPT
jgi:hypothetical protein